MNVQVSRRAGLLLALIAAATAFLLWLPGIGHWLIVQDPLEVSDAIVVMGGNLPFRSQEAASLYKGGWAKQVWITAPEQAAELEAVKNLGLSQVPPEELSRRVLELFGVPSTAILTLSSQATNTTHEIGLVVDRLRQSGGHRVILVTSKAHTRRVRANCIILAYRGQHCIARAIDRDVFDVDHWWVKPGDRQIVTHEVAGLVYVWGAVFPGHLLNAVF